LLIPSISLDLLDQRTSLYILATSICVVAYLCDPIGSTYLYVRHGLSFHLHLCTSACLLLTHNLYVLLVAAISVYLLVPSFSVYRMVLIITVHLLV
jgi:hypothetical protein